MGKEFRAKGAEFGSLAPRSMSDMSALGVNVQLGPYMYVAYTSQASCNA